MMDEPGPLNERGPQNDRGPLNEPGPPNERGSRNQRGPQERRPGGFGREHLGKLPKVDGEEMPRIHVTRRQALVFGVFVASALAFLYFVLPKLAGLRTTWDKLGQADLAWLFAAAALEIASFGGYIMLFRAVFVRGESRINWLESYEITMAGLAASRLFAAAGSGGVALTAWALRRSGMEARVVACRMIAFLVLLYAVYMGALFIDGIGLRTGVFPGGGGFAITIIPAVFAAASIVAMLALSLLPQDIERRLEAWGQGGRRGAKLVAKGVTAPALVASGVRTAISLLRAREIGSLGALIWWGFDIAVLWAAFHAFGTPPPFTVIVMAYFVGMLANVLPLPGGIGGVDGGMIGALIAFGVDGGLAVLAVLVYRAFSFWLPTIPGAVAYLQLRRTVHRWQEEREPDGGTGPQEPSSVVPA
ncbi:MAG: putative heme transporter [Solirubrobacteraceae bacterium]|nr:putative heme transporter [Solirubrobacteraceae bacterium]